MHMVPLGLYWPGLHGAQPVVEVVEGLQPGWQRVEGLGLGAAPLVQGHTLLACESLLLHWPLLP
jgi:hypothetical protein